MNIFAHDDGKRPAKIKTRLTAYNLSIDHANSLESYKAIQANRKVAGVKIFDSIPMGKFKEFVPEDGPIYLETAHIFGNQWNTTDGRRVFDWHEDIFPNKNVKRGHYLEITPEMVAVRKETFKCGYCGHNFHGLHNAGKFCPDCLGSEYLKEVQIHLLRVMPCDRDYKRAPLTPDERAALLPIYTQKQTTDTSARAMKRKEKIRADVIKEAETDTKNAVMKRDGFLWMLDRNINTENVIFYDHTQTFCAGWRTPLTGDTLMEFKHLMKGFPFKIEYK